MTFRCQESDLLRKGTVISCVTQVRRCMTRGFSASHNAQSSFKRMIRKRFFACSSRSAVSRGSPVVQRHPQAEWIGFANRCAGPEGRRPVEDAYSTTAMPSCRCEAGSAFASGESPSRAHAHIPDRSRAQARTCPERTGAHPTIMQLKKNAPDHGPEAYDFRWAESPLGRLD